MESTFSFSFWSECITYKSFLMIVFFAFSLRLLSICVRRFHRFCCWMFFSCFPLMLLLILLLLLLLFLLFIHHLELHPRLSLIFSYWDGFKKPELFVLCFDIVQFVRLESSFLLWIGIQWSVVFTVYCRTLWLTITKHYSFQPPNTLYGRYT